MSLESDLPVVSLSGEPELVSEGEPFTFIFTLSEPTPIGGLVVNLAVEDEDNEGPDGEFLLDQSTNVTDIRFLIENGQATGATVTLTEGATEGRLVTVPFVDGVKEGEEAATFTIIDGEGYSVNPENNIASFTITDLPVVTFSVSPTEVNEGEQLEWNFSLTQPVPVGGLVVNLDLVEDTDPLPGDIEYFVNGSTNVTDLELLVEDSLVQGATVTLAEGATQATLVSNIIADGVAEEPETIVFGLAESDSYSINPQVNNASFTLLDTISYGNYRKDDLFGGYGNYGNYRKDDLFGGYGNDTIFGGNFTNTGVGIVNLIQL